MVIFGSLNLILILFVKKNEEHTFNCDVNESILRLFLVSNDKAFYSKLLFSFAKCYKCNKKVVVVLSLSLFWGCKFI